MTDGHDSPDVPPSEAEVGGVHPQAVLDFWFRELEPEDHFNGGERVDATVRERFGDLVEGLQAAGYPHIWESKPDTALALLIALDQFPRNMHRGSGAAYLLDNIALDVAMRAIGRGFQEGMGPLRAKYVLMPLMHAEDMAVQDKAIPLFAEHTDPDTLAHAKAHREAIRRFGRFPARNAALGRQSTDAEIAYLEGGYARDLEAARSA